MIKIIVSFVFQLVRDVCRALITIDVHARDIVSEMVQIKVCLFLFELFYKYSFCFIIKEC